MNTNRDHTGISEGATGVGDFDFDETEYYEKISQQGLIPIDEESSGPHPQPPNMIKSKGLMDGIYSGVGAPLTSGQLSSSPLSRPPRTPPGPPSRSTPKKVSKFALALGFGPFHARGRGGVESMRSSGPPLGIEGGGPGPSPKGMKGILPPSRSSLSPDLSSPVNQGSIDLCSSPVRGGGPGGRGGVSRGGRRMSHYSMDDFEEESDPDGNNGRVELGSPVYSPEDFRRTSIPLEPSFYRIGAQMTDAQWFMNYQEAAIFLEEGDNNDQFSTHPKSKDALPAYTLAHTPCFYILDLLASLILLSLAVIEPPAIPAFKVQINGLTLTQQFVKVSIGFHASLELGALGIITLGLILKLRWLGLRVALSHSRTMIKIVTLIVMIVEALIVLGRQSSHFRVTRALRPIFLVDNRYMRGVRRFTRQVLQSLPPILDMLLLLFFFIIIFTVLGHFLFSHDPDDPFFTTLEDSFVNLFVLLTTANFPDVMMPSYNRNKWTVLFFIAYLITVLYLFMNLLLAVVYDTFITIEKEKFRKLVIHKRNACQYAFSLLISKSNTQGVIFRHFYGLMTQFAPEKSLRDIYLTFKALDKSNTGILSREDFGRFYEVSNLNWKPVGSLSSQREWLFCQDFGSKLQRFLNNAYSDHLFNVLVVLNSILMCARWVDGQTSHQSWDAYVFGIWFLIEMELKALTWGFQRIISSGWHSFDLVASLAYVFSLIFVMFVPGSNELLTFVRPLRLLRLFKLKKRYRNVFGTLFILIPPMTSAAFVILLLYYFFAIVGMEIFQGVPLKNCCNGTMLETFYAEGHGINSTGFALRYYLNSFDNLPSSLVTLFQLTVVNNWYVIMEGHVLVTNGYSRIYFISFYLVTMVLLTIIVAFILDTFLFRMQYKRVMDKKAEQRMLRTEVSLTGDEIDFCYRQDSENSGRRLQVLREYAEDLSVRGCVTYVGWRRRNKEILYKRMFKNEIPTWLRESELDLSRSSQIR